MGLADVRLWHLRDELEALQKDYKLNALDATAEAIRAKEDEIRIQEELVILEMARQSERAG
jgi:hypothetical protein